MKQPFAFVPPSDPAVRSYALLLRLYPPQFRRQYGGEMIILFRDCLRDARGEDGQAVTQLWLSTLFDVLVSAPRAHLEEWSNMQASYTRSSQIGAICAFVTAVSWMVLFGIGDAFGVLGDTVTSLILLAGTVAAAGALAGLYFRLNANQRSPITLVGGFAAMAGVLVIAAGLVGWIVDRENEWGWYALMSSMSLLMLAFGLMGVSASTQPTLGPLRFAPLLALFFPVMVVLIMSLFRDRGDPSGGIITGATMILALLGIVGTGALLWTKSR